MEQTRHVSALHQYPLPDMQALSAALAQAVEQSKLKIMVLDDDPTGVQTVHDVYVYTDWSVETLRRAFAAPEQLFFVLTNSRGFTESETVKAHTEIAEHAARAAGELGVDYMIVSRGDSTLRGHYPLETAVLRQVTEARCGTVLHGEVLCPYFKEGGRFTLDNVHYVRYGDALVPCGETEFAKDETFGYRSSNLCEYIAEKTGEGYRAEDVTVITQGSLRALDFEGIVNQLLAVKDFGKVIVNASEDCDVQAFAVALYMAMAKGHRFMIRCAAALVKALGNISSQPLLSREQMVTRESSSGGIIVVGSHTKKTTAQLEALKQLEDIVFIELDSDKVLVPGALEAEAAQVTARCSALLARGITCCVSTKRTVLVLPEDTPESALVRSVAISDALQSCVGKLTVTPAFVVAKGGITSSDVGVKALQVQCARVLGQIRPGIPVWQTGGESTFPGIPYVIFPGNVGEVTTLREAVEILM